MSTKTLKENPNLKRSLVFILLSTKKAYRSLDKPESQELHFTISEERSNFTNKRNWASSGLWKRWWSSRSALFTRICSIITEYILFLFFGSKSELLRSFCAQITGLIPKRNRPKKKAFYQQTITCLNILSSRFLINSLHNRKTWKNEFSFFGWACYGWNDYEELLYDGRWEKNINNLSIT